MEEEVEEEDEDLEDMDAFMGNGCTMVDYRASTISTMSSLSTASKDSMFSTLSVASSECSPSSLCISLSAAGLSASGTDSDYCEEVEEDSPSERSPASTLPPGSSAGHVHGHGAKSAKTPPRLSQRLSSLFKSRSSNSLCRAKSLGSPDARDLSASVRSKRSMSLPQQVQLRVSDLAVPPPVHPGLGPEAAGAGPYLRHVCFRRRPILSSDEEEEGGTATQTTQLRVVVFGADHVAGRVARAYSSLRRRASRCPRLCRTFKMRFFFVPVRRDAAAITGSTHTLSASKTPSPAGQQLAVSPLKSALSNLVRDTTTD